MKRKLHISTYNHDSYGVTDQINTLVFMLGKHMDVTSSDELMGGVDILLIENFTRFQIDEMHKHKEQYGRRLFVLLTEHMSLDNTGMLRLNEQAWMDKREYIPNLYMRFLNLVEMSCIVDAFLVLYGSPNVHDLRGIFPSSPIFDLSEYIHYPPNKNEVKEYDFCFIGSPTKYRESVVKELRTRFSVYSGTGLSDHERSQVIRASGYMLNIPQHTGWSNLSPMRVMASAREGVHTINVTKSNEKPFPNVTTIALSDLLNMDLNQVHERCSADTMEVYDQHIDSDLSKFIRWVS